MANKAFYMKILHNLSPVRFIDFIKELKNEFGIKFMVMLTSGYIGGRGVVQAYLALNETPYYKQAGYPVSVNQTARAISELPMALKGLAGIHTDFFPILGYKITAWMIFYAFVGSSCVLSLAIIPFDATSHPFYYPAALYFFAMIQVFFFDVMLQGKFSELMNKRSNSRGNVFAFVFLIITLSGFIPAITTGIFADVLPSPRYTFYITFPIALQPIFFLLYGCMPNDKVAPERNNKFDFKKFKLQLPVNILNIIVIFCSLGFLITLLFFSTNVAFYYSVASALFVMGIQFLFLPIQVSKISTYLIFGQGLYLQIQPTLEYYLLGDETCVPNGPYFSYTYLKTIIGIITKIGQLLGLWVYQSVITRLTYRQIYYVTIILRMAAAMFDLAIVNRWNVALGIPDEYFYLFGHAIVYEICYMIDVLPYGFIIAKMVPKNVEVTLFGCLASITNYGRTIAILAGGYVAQLFNIKTGLEGGQCNFDNINWLILVSNLFLPSLLVPLAFLLLPNIKVTDDFVSFNWENTRYIFKSFTNKKVEQA